MEFTIFQKLVRRQVISVQISPLSQADVSGVNESKLYLFSFVGLAKNLFFGVLQNFSG